MIWSTAFYFSFDIVEKLYDNAVNLSKGGGLCYREI